MAKIRVGDIEIDGSQITIGGQPMTSQPQQVVPAQPAPSAIVPYQTHAPLVAQPKNDLVKLPGRPISWVVAGVGFLALATIIGAIPYLFYLGFGVATIGVLKNRAHREERRHNRLLEEQKQKQLEASFAPIRERLRRLLQEASAPMTVEQIAQQVRLSQTELLRGLVMLRDQGEVTEDLNVESGEWVYALAKKQLPPQDLDARIAALEAQEVNVRNR